MDFPSFTVGVCRKERVGNGPSGLLLTFLYFQHSIPLLKLTLGVSACLSWSPAARQGESLERASSAGRRYGPGQAMSISDWSMNCFANLDPCFLYWGLSGIFQVSNMFD